MVVLVPEIFQDSRGFFMETYREDKFRELGLPHQFVQDNHSRSAKGLCAAYTSSGIRPWAS